AIVGLFDEAGDYVQRFGHDAGGFLLIVDELGKFLEYGAMNPDHGDVFVLQELAEAAARSKRPFLVVTILHQAIDRYAEHMSGGRRAEWAKVQGRFEDVAFEECTEQLMRMLAYAIRHSEDDAFSKSLRRQAKTLAKEACALDTHIGTMAGTELQDCLARCYPL